MVNSNSLRKIGSQSTTKHLASLLVEFVDSEKSALKNARKLRSNSLYADVYVNRDMTKSERIVEANLRAVRKTRNEALPHIENDKRYGIDTTTNKRYYWGETGGLSKFIHVPPSNNKLQTNSKMKTSFKYHKSSELNSGDNNLFLKDLSASNSNLNENNYFLLTNQQILFI